jgi:serine-type D-Ala-D-Ala carboxypeptidase (penicillin-binding protein 5/6)
VLWPAMTCGQTYSPRMRRFPLLLIIALIVIGFLAPPAQAADPLKAKGVIVDAAASPVPNVWAKTWVIADAQTGEILAAKRAHKKRAPASTIKMLTALTVLPQLPLESTYVARKKAVNMYGSRVGLIKGKSYTINDLMNAMMLPSANDAAVALAQANGGVKRTVQQMNEVAAQLNATNTVAKNPSGLDAPGMVSTAYDLALIARAGLSQPVFSEYVQRTRAQFPTKGKKKTKTIYTTNRLLLGNYKGAMGVKTGFTSNAGRTFVGSAQRNGRTLIVSMMGINERTDVAAIKLLDWGFANVGRITPVGTLVDAVSPLPADDQPIAQGGGEVVDVENIALAPAPVEIEVIPAASSTNSPPIGWFVVALTVLFIGLLIMMRRRAVKRARHALR